MAHSDESEKPSTTLPAKVEKIIRPLNPRAPETAEIAVDNAEDLYREILVDEKGEEVGLKPGASVEVTIEADEKDTVKKEKKKDGGI